MIKMISAFTGAEMMVHEDRVDEYLERGFARLAAPPPPPPVKKTRTTTKKPAGK